MRFKDVIGQQEVKGRLVNLVSQNRLSHALLFLGKEGTGALTLAIAFAQYIVCVSAKLSKKSGPGLVGEIPALPLNGKPEVMKHSCGI
jgi:DNA polymerase-3 subunit delta'